MLIIKTEHLVRALKAAKLAVSKDVSRTHLQNVLLQLNGSVLNAAATDGTILAVVDIPVVCEPPKTFEKLLAPAEIELLLATMKAKGLDEVDVVEATAAITDKNVKYPPWQRVRAECLKNELAVGFFDFKKLNVAARMLKNFGAEKVEITTAELSIYLRAGGDDPDFKIEILFLGLRKDEKL